MVAGNVIQDVLSTGMTVRKWYNREGELQIRYFYRYLGQCS